MNRNCRVTVIALLALALTACGGGGGGGDDGGPPTGPPSNESPTADLSASPGSGNAPLEVSLDLSCSDPDGSIRESRLDANGDGSFEHTSSSSSIQVDTTYRTEETVTVAGQCVDDDGAESSEATQNVSVEVITRTIQILGASPEPGEGLVPLAGAFVITGLEGETARDTLETNADGEVVIEPVEETGNYVLMVRDELGSGLGDWFDIANSDSVVTREVTEDQEEDHVLLPVVPLHPDDDFYRNSLHWLKDVPGSIAQVSQGKIGEPAPPPLEPKRVWIDPDTAGTEAQLAAIRIGIDRWNGESGAYSNFSFVEDSAEANLRVYTTRDPDRCTCVDADGGGPNDIDPRITFNVRHQSDSAQLADNLGPHEASHIMRGGGEAESTEYCSNPVCRNGVTDLELRVFEAAQVLKAHMIDKYGADRVASSLREEWVRPFPIYAEE